MTPPSHAKLSPELPRARDLRSPAPSSGFIAAIRALRRPLILGHVVPDADCLGSILGLASTLRDAGAHPAMGLPTPAVAKRLQFMLALDNETPVLSGVPADCDGFIILDTASHKRINFEPKPEAGGPLPIFNIDHHVTNTDFGDHNWVDPHASSASEMVIRLVESMGLALSPAAASLLYAGLHGDTAGFSLPSTSAESLDAAAKLVRSGADVAHIGEQLCRSQGQPDFELLRRVYEHTSTTADGRIALSYLTFDDIVSSGCSPEDIDDQVSIPRALRGVQIAMLFSEGEPNVIRVNLRGEGKITVLEVAQAFGGGGHTQSAGIRIRGKPMTDVIAAVVAAAKAHLEGCPISPPGESRPAAT